MIHDGDDYHDGQGHNHFTRTVTVTLLQVSTTTTYNVEKGLQQRPQDCSESWLELQL